MHGFLSAVTGKHALMLLCKNPFFPAYIYLQAVVLLLTILVAVVKISVAPFVYTNYDESAGMERGVERLYYDEKS